MKKITHDEFISDMKTKRPDVEILSHYINDGCEIKVKYKCGHIKMATPSNLKRGLNNCEQKQCQYERKHKQFVNDIKILSPGVEVVGKYNGFRGRISVKCKICNYEWITKPGKLKGGSGCIKCWNKKNKTTHEEFMEKIKKLSPEIQIISKYEHHLLPILVKYECGHIHKKPRAVGIVNGQGCPRCAKLRNGVGKNELKYFTPYLIKILSQYIIEPQYPIINKDTGRSYFVDFYIQSENLAIEYDEKHHIKRQNEDYERQLYIESEIGCKFIRISDEKFMKDNMYANEVLQDYIEHKIEDISSLFI